MAHGTPDWGLVGPKATVYGLDDMGELAVRMGSPHTWDRRGDVLHLTDFSDGLGAMDVGYGSHEAAVALATGHSRHGAYAVKLTSGKVIEGFADIYIQLPYPVTSGIGVEFSFSLPDADVRWCARLYWSDKVDQWQARVRLNQVGHPTAVWEYYNSAGAYVEFGEAEYYQSGVQPVHTVKMVVDITEQEYVRVIHNETEYDLAGIGVRDAGAMTYTRLLAYALLEGSAVDNRVAYVDSFIVTQNEPV